MDTPTIVDTDSSNPELAIELAIQREKDREIAAWKRFGMLGFDGYVSWIMNPESCEISHFE